MKTRLIKIAACSQHASKLAVFYCLRAIKTLCRLHWRQWSLFISEAVWQADHGKHTHTQSIHVTHSKYAYIFTLYINIYRLHMVTQLYAVYICLKMLPQRSSAKSVIQSILAVLYYYCLSCKNVLNRLMECFLNSEGIIVSLCLTFYIVWRILSLTVRHSKERPN